MAIKVRALEIAKERNQNYNHLKELIKQQKYVGRLKITQKISGQFLSGQ